jgi:hypothetical protein
MAKPRVVHAAPLPTGVAGERELADILLSERMAVADVRTAIEAALPPGDVLVDLHDVWLGAPPLSGQVRAAAYRVVARGAAPPDVAAGLARLLAAASLPRVRERGSGPAAYDLRPLLADARLAAPGPPATFDLVLRLDPSLGTGRPLEALAALVDPGAGGVRGLEVDSIVRLGLVLADEAPSWT